MSKEKTMENLAAAFSGESQANRKYLAFAKKADSEGFHQVARLFRAAAEAETIHAHTHLATMDGIGSTEDNLKTAVEGETYEFTSMYPSFIEDAAAEGHKQAERSFRLANEAEKVHADLFVRAAKEPSAEKEFDYYLCSVCGHIAEGSAPSKCPLCGAAEKAYRLVK